MYRSILLSTALLILNVSPGAFGQSYNYRYGDSRVVIQSQTGLSQPSSTYIGPGTMSKSAQGVLQSGAQVNPGLPKVNMGSFVGTAGDNQYGNNPIRSQAQKRAQMRQPVKIIYAQPARPQGHVYIPGQNTAAEYSNGTSELPVQFDGKGAATYGNANSSNQAASQSSARRY